MNFKKTTLDNGLRIITAPQPGNQAVTILVLVEAGSEYETKEINGLSHFLEHLVFKGTKRRPKAIDISAELDGIGAIYNAFTGQEYTGYFAKADKGHFEKILDVVSDMYLNPIFDPAEIDKERGVIVEEINMYEDLPMRRVSEVFAELLYGDEPAGWSIAGEKEVIRRLTRDDIVRYRSKHYLAGSTVVVVSGAIDEEEVIKKISATFAEMPLGEKPVKPEMRESQTAPAMLLKTKETDQTHLVLGVRGFDVFDKRRYAVEVLADMLGGGMSSRLWQKIRDEMGAAYYVRAGVDLFIDHGYLAVGAGVDHRKIKEVIEAVVNEFKEIKSGKFAVAELQRAKEHLVGHLMLGIETSDALAGFYGLQEIITGKITTPEEIAKKVQAVKKDDIIDVAKELFQNEKLNLAIISPLKKEAEEELQSALKIA